MRSLDKALPYLSAFNNYFEQINDDDDDVNEIYDNSWLYSGCTNTSLTGVLLDKNIMGI